MESGKFANSLGRMIRVSDKGVPFVMTKDGKRSYKPKAAFKKNTAGSLIRLKPTNTVPKVIAPARVPAPPKTKGGPRKVRKNVGVKRGPREATLYRMVFGSAKMPGAARKVRSNKGTKRKLVASPSGKLYKGKAAASRRKTTQARRKLVAQNPFASLMMRR